MIKKNIVRKLDRMVSLDQKMRRQAEETGFWGRNIGDIDKKNTKELKKIVEKYGWPTVALVGKKASRQAWLIVQHAGHDIIFQKKALDLMKKIYINNPKNIDKQNIAFLRDRVLINQKRKQLYGTQFYIDKKGRLAPYLIASRDKLDKRRREYNLPPFENYLDYIKKYNKKGR